jgi:flagellar biosynthesis protein FliQ
MNEVIAEAFKTGMILAGSFGFIGFVVGLCINLLKDFGRG